MSQPWQPPPQSPYGPPGQAGFPPHPMPPGHPYPGFPPPSRGKPVLAVFLALLISVIGAQVYGGILLASYEDLTPDGLRITYVIFALVLAALIGAVAGRLAGPNVGAQLFTAVPAMLGTFFGFTNGYVFALLDADSDIVETMLEEEPLHPAEAWWEALDGGIALLGLAVAAGVAFGVAHLIGKRQRH